MTEVFPNYYDKFECIADKCHHSCCVGWEIDIDDETMEFYNSLGGEIGEKIRRSIAGDPPHFTLGEGERCPHLNERGLCDIILQLGDGAICDICHLHPRFSNFYEDFTETGLGLCCEEAVRVILTEEEKFRVPTPVGVAHEAFFRDRAEIFDILQNREVTVFERFRTLSRKYGIDFYFKNEELYKFYMSLERLDDAWEEKLSKLRAAERTEVFEREDLQILFEQLACYFIFRHFESGVGFALLSLWVIGAIASECENRDEIFDVVRMYSSEVEYSEENLEDTKKFLAKIKMGDLL